MVEQFTVQPNVPVDAMVRIALYDALGRKVTDLKEGSLQCWCV